jgi:prepilin-type N-terminal cleavage/methylation domain-containing protein
MITHKLYDFKKGKKAFTLVELIIVIVIIWILTISLIPKIMGIQDRAKKSAAQYELRQIWQLMFLAQQNYGLTLREITNSTCTYCANATHDMPNRIVYLWKDKTSWVNALSKISEAGWNKASLEAFHTDPWGYPYLFDENEWEFYENSNCRVDTLLSVGNDWATTFSWTLYYYSSDHNLDSDNVKVDLRPLFCSWSY